jgi:hypothetical protein
MLIDAVRRRAELPWLLLLIFLGPLSSIVYFFAVKIHDYNLSRFRLGTRPRSLSDLRYRALETPSIANKVTLADALEASEQYGEALDVYQDALRADPTNKEALHGSARALLGLNKPAEAAESLAKLLELDNSFRDYGAALDYAEALWQNSQREDAIELLTGLVGVSSRMNHRLALAHYMARAGREGPARDQLELALRDYEHAPAFIKNRDKKWAQRAQQMLAELG